LDPAARRRLGDGHEARRQDATGVSDRIEDDVIRHAGAKQVHLKLVGHNGLFTGEIVDDGCGFDTASIRPNGNDRRGLGLAGMHERVAQCGGKLEIISQPGAGTMLRVRIPLPETDNA